MSWELRKVLESRGIKVLPEVLVCHGKVGLFGGAGFNTLKDGFIAIHGNTWSRGEYLQTLDRLAGEKVDITLGNHTSQARMLEKHAEAVREGSCRPFVDREEFGRFIGERRERFHAEFG